MFGFAMATGDPYRIIYGYDVSGDVCGANNVKISGVGMSGKDLSQNSLEHFCILAFMPTMEHTPLNGQVFKVVLGFKSY